jgi:hypothetical protein
LKRAIDPPQIWNHLRVAVTKTYHKAAYPAHNTRGLLYGQTYEPGRPIDRNAVEFDDIQQTMIASYDTVSLSRDSERKEFVVF